jgi:hypothetical protein
MKAGDGKIPLFYDPQMMGEFFYSLMGGLTSVEESTITISATNKFLDFNIGAAELIATVAEASYKIGTVQTEAGTLCKAIYDAIVAAEVVGTYTVTYSRSTKKFTITRSTGTFVLMLKTGTHGSDNTDTHIGTTLGFVDTADLTGALTYTGANTVNYAFKHTFTNTGIQKPSYTFFLDRSINVLKYNLGTVKTLTLKGSNDGFVEAEASVLFKSEASGSIGSPSYPTQKYLSFQNVDFKIAGSSNTDVKEWNLKLDNTAAPHRTLALSQEVSDIIAAGKFSIDGGFTIYFQNTTERDKFLANTAVAIRILSQGDTIAGTSKYGIDINVYEAHYKAFPYGEDAGLLAAKATFEGFYSSGSSKALQIDLINVDVSY